MSSLQSLNPFGDRGYVQLPTSEAPGAPLPASNRREEEDAWFALSQWDRLLIFGGLQPRGSRLFRHLLLSFSPSYLWRKPRKLVVLLDVVPVVLCRYHGPVGPTLKHLCLQPRGCLLQPPTSDPLGLTLYFSIGLQSTILTMFAGLIQLASLLWYLVSYFPMGSSGLRLVSSFGARRAAAWMTS